jgi:hypothetical protein
MITSIAALVRALASPQYSDQDDKRIQMNDRGDLLVAQALPDRAEIVRMGQSYFSIGTTAVAPVAAIPSTAAHFVLFNNEPAGSGKSYLIDFIGTQITTSAGAAINLGMAHILQPAGITANPSGAVAIYSLDGKSNYRGNGNCKSAATITAPAAAAGAWMPVGPTLVCANTANLMLGVEAEIKGKIIVPPQGCYGLASLCNAAGSAVCTPWIIWHEIFTKLP